MSEVSTVYDAFITRIAAVLTTHTRLTDPYKIEENPDTLLRQGYGVAIGEGENTTRPMQGILSLRRSFDVTISRRYAATDLNAAGKATTEKQIMEDMFLLIDDFHENTTLTNGNRVVGFRSDNGINFVQKDTDRFMYTTGTFSIEYFETTN